MACVNILPPMQSLYRWQGAIESASEQQLVMKTTMGCVERLRERLTSPAPVRGAGVPGHRSQWRKRGVSGVAAPGNGPTTPIARDQTVCAGRVLPEPLQIERLGQEQGAQLRGFRAQHRIVESRDHQPLGVGAVLPREVNQLEPVVVAQPDVDDDDRRLGLTEIRARVLEGAERLRLVPPVFQNLLDRHEAADVVVDDDHQTRGDDRRWEWRMARAWCRSMMVDLLCGRSAASRLPPPPDGWRAIARWCGTAGTADGSCACAGSPGTACSLRWAC